LERCKQETNDAKIELVKALQREQELKEQLEIEVGIIKSWMESGVKNRTLHQDKIEKITGQLEKSLYITSI